MSIIMRPAIWAPGDESLDMYNHKEGCFQLFTTDLIEFVKLLSDDAGMSFRMCIGDQESDDWRFGIALKQGSHVMMLCDGEDPTFHLIDDLRADTYEFKIPSPLVQTPPARIAHENVVIFSHGFSPDVGPNYRYIRSLEAFLKGLGNWRVIVPDYRESYRCESIQHGHTERKKMLIEELACLGGHQSRVVLIGKSQGGAVSSSVCTPRLSKACKIVGLILIGAENPLSYNRDMPKPSVDHISIIHASGDRVIHPESLSQLAERWGGAACHILPSKIMSGKKDMMGNDIAHAFLEKHLFLGSMELVKQSLDICEHL